MITMTAKPQRSLLIAAAVSVGVLCLAAVPLLSSKAQVAAPAAPPATQAQQPADAAPAGGPPKPGPDGRMPESVEADVSTRSVAVTSSFTGTEIIEDDRSGLLAEPDDVRSLAAALDRLAGDPGLRARL